MGWLAWVAGLAAVGVVLAVVMPLVLRPLLRRRRARAFRQASRGFHLQREKLEARFLDRAAASGKPRGLRWVECEFDDAVTYAHDRSNHRLTALVAVSIRFEAIEGGGMEEVEAVGNLKAASAVFHYDGRQWLTDGRAIFNLNPAEAIQYYRSNLELVAEEAAASR
jgi:hypothetical protein